MFLFNFIIRPALIAGLCFSALIAQSEKWLKYESSEFGYKLELPLKPEVKLNKKPFLFFFDAQTETLSVRYDSTRKEGVFYYHIFVLSYPKWFRFFTDSDDGDTYLKRVRESESIMYNRSEIAQVYKKKITYHGYPCWDLLSYKQFDSFRLKIFERLLLVNGSLYYLQAFKTDNDIKEESIERFLNSLSFD